jgi:hypothetical protein
MTVLWITAVSTPDQLCIGADVERRASGKSSAWARAWTAGHA